MVRPPSRPPSTGPWTSSRNRASPTASRAYAYVACRKEADGHAAAFLICDCCGVTREIEPKASAEIIAAGEAAGYTLTAVTIEAHGLCADCRS